MKIHILATTQWRENKNKPDMFLSTALALTDDYRKEYLRQSEMMISIPLSNSGNYVHHLCI
jgi:hypothetical protein